MEEVKTKYPGVYQIDRGYRIRVYLKDPRTGKTKEVVKTLEGATVREALKARCLLREEIKAEKPSTGRMTLSVFARRWLEERARLDRYSTLDTRLCSLENHILPQLGNVFLDEFTPLMVKDWLREAAGKQQANGEPYAARTVNGWLRVFKAMVRDAVVDLDLPRDPTMGVHALVEEAYREDNSLTSEEAQSFLTAAKAFPEQYPMILAGFATGMRFGEISALHWQDIDLETGFILVQRSQVRGHIALPKTGKIRRVPIPQEVATVLLKHRQELMERQAPGFSDGLVFPTETGGYHSGTFLAKVFTKILKATGIAKRFTPHGMRRTFNNLMVEAGVDRVVLWATIGHSSERMTEHYSQIGDSAKRQVTDQVNRLLALPIGSKTGLPPEQKKTPSEAANSTRRFH